MSDMGMEDIAPIVAKLLGLSCTLPDRVFYFFSILLKESLRHGGTDVARPMALTFDCIFLS
ncbi:hypothetical protein QNI22_14160 [Cytophagaceae bacterium BD1B2-1]|uniref:Uncharacterized protein n=1 Tax=Xanthocytophaga agilis TaxID=3048010 RepID=A0AAE3R570_9BACT|nr:hypothetical protein [Xanthocytophaga agilis]